MARKYNRKYVNPKDEWPVWAEWALFFATIIVFGVLIVGVLIAYG